MDGIRKGEIYDSSRRLCGWNTPQYNAEDWKTPLETTGPGGNLKTSLMPPVRVCQVVNPVFCNIITENIRVYDMGFSMAGRAEI